jgi:hypothetical protein
MPMQKNIERLNECVSKLNDRMNKIQNSNLSEEVKIKRCARIQAKIDKINEKLSELNA